MDFYSAEKAKQVQDFAMRNAASIIPCRRVSWTGIGHYKISSSLGKYPEEPPKTQKITTTTIEEKEKKNVDSN